MARALIAGGLMALLASAAVAQSTEGLSPVGGHEAERRWIAEHPEALQALGNMPREDVAKVLDTYKNLPPADQQKLRDHAEELQTLGPQERKWALDNPDAMRQLGNLSDADRKKLLDPYKSLSPAEQAKLREHAGELQSLSPEERQWALDHPDAARQIGNLPEGQLDHLLEAYRQLPPESQERLMGR